ncbi:MAG: hypothetical protein HC911_00420 [Chloroflexaceae bacterium]|nr:hypothetical protein [Chloroflexaceae bacterium]
MGHQRWLTARRPTPNPSSDLELVARVTDWDPRHPYSKAGLTIRSSTAPDAAHLSVFVTGADGVRVQRRSLNGIGSADAGQGGPDTVVLSTWLRIVKQGNTLQGFFSTAANPQTGDWQPIGNPVFIGLDSTYLAGFAVSARDEGNLASATFDNIRLGAPIAGNVDCDSPSVPGAWETFDIGTGTTGTTIDSGNSLLVCGSGARHWSTSDGLRLAVQPQTSNDLELVARVTDWDPRHPYSKAGLTIRSSTAPNAAHLSVFVTGADGVRVQRRSLNGIGSADAGQGGPDAVVLPTWLRIVKQRNTLQGFFSTAATPQASDWQPIGNPVFIGLDSTYLTGFAVSARDEGELASATFDNIALDTMLLAADFVEVAEQGESTYREPAAVFPLHLPLIMRGR